MFTARYGLIAYIKQNTFSLLNVKSYDNDSRNYDHISQYMTNCTYQSPTQDTSIHVAGTRFYCNENIDNIRFCSGDSGKLEHFTSYV